VGHYQNLHRLVMIAALASITMANVAQGGVDRPANAGTSAVSNAKWKEECGACHVAFPPRFQPAGVWRTLMHGLDNHFGSDATLDAAAVEEITAFLEKNAVGEGRPASEGEARRLSVERGERFFKETHGNEFRCASCHNDNPAEPGKSERTGNAIEPLAPYVNAERFTDNGKVERMFKRNCGYVLGRDCTEQEKRDVLAYLLSINSPLRITGTRWFRSRHSAVEPAVAKPDDCQICHTRPKSMSNCAACHKHAENDNFIEHDAAIAK
jgi:hypothetical protein